MHYFYFNIFARARKIYKSDIVTEPSLGVKKVMTLPVDDIYDAAASAHQHYDLSLDSITFLMVKHGKRTYPRTVHIIENWVSGISSEDVP